MDFSEFYKSLTEEQREYLEEWQDILVEASNDFFDDWVEYGEECDLLNFIRTGNDAKLIRDITGVTSDSFIDLLKSDRGQFINNRYGFLS